MVSKDELEEGIKGDIHKHIEYQQVSIALGEDAGTPIAYIYNIPQQSVDRGYLAVRASENGGSNPEVAEPTPYEYAVGFDCYTMTDEEMIEVCERTVEDIGYSTEEKIDSTPTIEDQSQSPTFDESGASTVQKNNSCEISVSDEVESEEQDNADIDLSDEF